MEYGMLIVLALLIVVIYLMGKALLTLINTNIGAERKSPSYLYTRKKFIMFYRKLSGQTI